MVLDLINDCWFFLVIFGFSFYIFRVTCVLGEVLFSCKWGLGLGGKFRAGFLIIELYCVVWEEGRNLSYSEEWYIFFYVYVLD